MKCAYVFHFGQFLVMLGVFLSDDEPIFVVLFPCSYASVCYCVSQLLPV